MTVHYIYPHGYNGQQHQENNQEANRRSSRNNRNGHNNRNNRRINRAGGSSNYILMAARSVDQVLDRVRRERLNVGEFFVYIFKSIIA